MCQNMSEKRSENSLKLHISFILSFKRVINPSQIDAKRRNSNLIFITLKQSHTQNFCQINLSEHVGEKCRKLCNSYILKFPKDA